MKPWCSVAVNAASYPPDRTSSAVASMSAGSMNGEVHWTGSVIAPPRRGDGPVAERDATPSAVEVAAQLLPHRQLALVHDLHAVTEGGLDHADVAHQPAEPGRLDRRGLIRSPERPVE